MFGAPAWDRCQILEADQDQSELGERVEFFRSQAGPGWWRLNHGRVADRIGGNGDDQQRAAVGQHRLHAGRPGTGQQPVGHQWPRIRSNRSLRPLDPPADPGGHQRWAAGPQTRLAAAFAAAVPTLRPTTRAATSSGPFRTGPAAMTPTNAITATAFPIPATNATDLRARRHR